MLANPQRGILFKALTQTSCYCYPVTQPVAENFPCLPPSLTLPRVLEDLDGDFVPTGDTEDLHV